MIIESNIGITISLLQRTVIIWIDTSWSCNFSLLFTTFTSWYTYPNEKQNPSTITKEVPSFSHFYLPSQKKGGSEGVLEPLQIPLPGFEITSVVLLDTPSTNRGRRVQQWPSHTYRRWYQAYRSVDWVEPKLASQDDTWRGDTSLSRCRSGNLRSHTSSFLPSEIDGFPSFEIP